MTHRSEHISDSPQQPDFTSLTNAAAVARIRQLAAQGLPDGTLADLFGWDRGDVRRAIASAPARPIS
jgi:hypothetical protein